MSWCIRGYPRSAYSRGVRLKRKREGSAFDRWGGEPFFVALVDRFYEGVATDPLLRPMYPEDLTESRAHLALFLMQYWGVRPATANSGAIPVCACATPPSPSVRPSPRRGSGT